MGRAVISKHFGVSKAADFAVLLLHSKISGWTILSKRKKVKFLIDNWMLLSITLASGAMLVWPMVASGMGSALSASAAVQLINREKAVVVDVGEADEYALGHVGGAKNVPFGELENKLALAVKNKGLPLILVCPTGARANRAVAVAKKLGYEQAQALSGGIKAWKDANLPLEKA